MLYITINEDGSPHYCRYLFETNEKMFPHEQQVRQIKDAADEANQRNFAARTTNITIWTDFLNLIRQFIQEWGHDLVPKDICVAMIQIKESLGIPPTFQE
jgi:hypothetical protein